MRLSVLLLVVCFVAACQPADPWQGSVGDLLRSQPERFAQVMSDPEGYRVQIIYTQIDRDADNRPSFRSYTYRLDANEYFYPASTVKLPTAALALEKLALLNRRGLDRDSVMLTGRSEAWQTEATIDETSRTGLPSVAQYVRKILLVSDNDAFNRLYEFLGQQELNESLRRKGFANTRIIHRLEIPLDSEQNRISNPSRFMRGDETVYQQPPRRSPVSFSGDAPELLGLAEIVDGQRLERPKDFAEKNAFALQDLHDTVKVLMFPESENPQRRFQLSADDSAFLRRYMSEYPGESGVAAYSDEQIYPEGFVKFLLYGGDAPVIPRHLRIFNKVGDAYGFLTDAAYVADFENKVEFLLAATVYTNANQTFNDNKYEYDDVGLPFLQNLGQAIYEIELTRQREYAPDLGELQKLRGAK
jgi:hypothetical protein